MGEIGSWEGIRQHGLLSASGLLDISEVVGAEGSGIEREHRPEFVKLPGGGTAETLIRDQKPVHPELLARCLTDMSPSQRYRLLNGKVLIWLTEARLKRFLHAKPYRNREHLVLTVDTSELCHVTLTRSRSSAVMV